jgi:hypothetical protein
LQETPGFPIGKTRKRAFFMECGGRATKARRHRFALRNLSPIQSGVVVEDSRAAALHNLVATVGVILTGHSVRDFFCETPGLYSGMTVYRTPFGVRGFAPLLMGSSCDPWQNARIRQI